LAVLITLLISSPNPAVLLIMPLVHLIRSTIGLLIIGWHGYAPDSSRAKRCLLFRYYDKADEALAAPDPAAALDYAADQVTAGRTYSPADLRRDVRTVAAARGGPVRERPPSPQVRLRVTRRDGSRWPAAEAVAFDLVDIAAIEVETPWGRAVLAIDGHAASSRGGRESEGDGLLVDARERGTRVWASLVRVRASHERRTRDRAIGLPGVAFPGAPAPAPACVACGPHRREHTAPARARARREKRRW